MSNNKSIINIQQTEYQDINQSMNNSYLAENYNFPVSDLGLSIEQSKEFVIDLEKSYNLNKYEFDVSSFKTITYFEEVEKKFLIILEEYPDSVHVDLYTLTIDKSKELFDLYSKYRKKNDDIIINYYSAYLVNGGQISTTNKQMNIKDFDDIKKSYYPYLDTDLMFQQFFKVKESLMVLLGEPGLGKTKLISQSIKYLVQNIKSLPSPDGMFDTINILYVKNDDIIVQDKFWNMLEEGEYHLVILDDLDFYLNKRNKTVDNALDEKVNKFINYFLSFTDGVTENDVKFIITSNKDYEDIDKAILRKGRTFDILNLRRLKYEEALNIWLEENLSKEDFESIFKEGYESGIVSSDLGHEINLRKVLKEDQILAKYVKEDKISIYNSMKIEKKTGYEI